MFGNDRNQIRQVYTEAWRKHRNNEPLEPLEQMIVGVIGLHPEYHALLENPDSTIDRDWLPEHGETNPFLHMGMHIAIQEQLGTDRPAGIVDIYQQLVARTGDAHAADHAVMECLGEVLWQAQHSNRMPDDAAYLGCLRKLLR
ncbi:MAG: DUF1841 family protein [Granulosicoccaceae bacterium]|jgi:hypothetical protein